MDPTFEWRFSQWRKATGHNDTPASRRQFVAELLRSVVAVVVATTVRW